jgi:hypothetical protein
MMYHMAQNDERFLEMLADSNPWWENGKVPASMAPAFIRRDFYTLKTRVRGENKIVALSGPRQVGKTTLLYQLIRDLLAEGMDPKRVIFLSMDHPGLDRVSDDPIVDLGHLYEERILRKELRTSKDVHFVFLDEITHTADWHKKLKGWYDRRLPLSFAISSSSNPNLQEGAAESLTGRVTVQLLMPMKFSDVLSMRSGDRSHVHPSLEARNSMLPAIRKGEPGELLSKLRGFYPRGAKERTALAIALDWYMLSDGFPELADKDDPFLAARRLQEYMELTLAHDLYRFYRIRSTTRVLEDLLSVVASQSGQLTSYQNLANAIGMERRLLERYLDILEGTYFIQRSQFYSRSSSKRQRKPRKLYIANPGYLNILRGRFDLAVLKDGVMTGLLAESLAREHLLRMCYNISPGVSPQIYYWQDLNKHEVDMVVEIEGKPLPIEVKYRADPKRDLRGMTSFFEQFAPPFGIVVTKDLLELDGKTLFIPLADFLLMA